MTRFAAGTIVAKSCLSLARVLADSLRRHHPDVPFFVLLADETDGFFDPAGESFHLLRLEQLSIPDLPRFRFNYTQQELSYAATPYLLAFLLDQRCAGVAFMKQESLVMDDMAPIFAGVCQSSITLTPHLLRPLAGEDRAARELNILQSGVYNIGFLGVSDRPQARAFLNWWQDRVYRHCRHDVPQGMHYEQRWIDLVPAFFEEINIVRDPGFNVGHWNLPEREIRFDGKEFTVDGRPCRFFRFSGFDPERPHLATKYSNRLTAANLGPAAEVFRRYLTLLEAAGYHETKNWPYAHGYFDNGVPIPDVARQIYRDLEDNGHFGNPFNASPPGSFYNWLNEQAIEHQERTAPVTATDHPLPALHERGTITHLWHGVYDRRPDVRQAFPDLHGADRAAFLRWAASQGMKEHKIPEEFRPGIREEAGRSG